jgi:hypothetical protein
MVKGFNENSRSLVAAGDVKKSHCGDAACRDESVTLRGWLMVDLLSEFTHSSKDWSVGCEKREEVGVSADIWFSDGF